MNIIKDVCLNINIANYLNITKVYSTKTSQQNDILYPSIYASSQDQLEIGISIVREPGVLVVLAVGFVAVDLRRVEHVAEDPGAESV